MTDYLAVLKARLREKPLHLVPSKPPKAAFEGFEGDQGSRFLAREWRHRPDLPTLVALYPGVPREWVEGFQRLECDNPASGFSNSQWSLLIRSGSAFLEQWAPKAAELGWTDIDLFGVHPTAPAARFDVMGLVPIINGGEVVAITERSATIRSPGGSRLVYMRRTTGGRVCLWELISK
jgi:hypothetical protein